MDAEQAFIFKQPGAKYRRIWVDPYKTRLRAEAVGAFAGHVQAIEGTINSFVILRGCVPMRKAGIHARPKR